jgi:biotin synthase
MRTDWSPIEVSAIYCQPLLDLLLQAQRTHREFHPANEVQMCRLLSIKTGGCPEDCGYCPQSAHYTTAVERQPLMNKNEVLTFARAAKAEGTTRFCMGAAWRQAPEGSEFDSVLESVRAVAELGLEVCCTLGMLTEPQAFRLKEAGLTAYNHNLDTSPEFYGTVIGTRLYGDRLATIVAVRKAGITVCCGGILGMGESDDDRIGLLRELATMNPESEPFHAVRRLEQSGRLKSLSEGPHFLLRTGDRLLG